MEEEKRFILKLFKDYLGCFLTVCGAFLSIITGILCLWQVSQNYLKSIFFHVDFNLFHIHVDLYQYLFQFLLIITCYIIVRSFFKTFSFLWKKIIQKLSVEIPVFDMILCGVVLSILVVLTIFLPFFLVLFFLFVMFSYGLAVKIVLTFFRISEKIDKENESKPFNLKKEFIRIIPEFGLLMVFELLLSFFFFFFSISSNKSYYIIENEQENRVEVVIETYPDYYITKLASIQDNSLIISWNSQRIRNSKDAFAVEISFDSISIEK